jgi:hypothetical protein
MVTLPKGDYPNYAELEADKDVPTYKNQSTYYPVKWTLTKYGAKVAEGNLAAIETYLNSLEGIYHVDSADGQKVFADIVGTYYLDWTWDFEVDDVKDTILGQIAAGTIDASAITGYKANETLSLYLEVTQVD